MAELRYREALGEALREELRRDERVFLMGEDIGVFGGAFKVTEGLLEEFGEQRVRDTPISENTIVGMGVGAAMAGPATGRRADDDQLLAARVRPDRQPRGAHPLHVRRAGRACRCVVRMPQGAGHQLGPTHSHCFEALYLHVPGLLVAVPSTPADAKGLLKAAIRDENPVIFIEHESLYGERGEVPDGEPITSSPSAGPRFAARARDVTIVGISRMARTAETRRRSARRAPRGERRGDRPPHAAAARPRHDPRLGAQDQPLRDRRGGLAARRGGSQPRRADHASRPSTTSTRPSSASAGPTCRCPTRRHSRTSPTRTSRR